MMTINSQIGWVRRHWLVSAAVALLLLLFAIILIPDPFVVQRKAESMVALPPATDQEEKPAALQLEAPSGSPGSVVAGIVGGVPGGSPATRHAGLANSTPLTDARKIVRTSSMELTVTSPIEAAEKIRVLAEQLGGYVESAQVSSHDFPSARLTIRVPAARLEDAKTSLRGLAGRVDSENTEAQDVTKQYVDSAARIRNLRAEEAQYLEILHSAVKVPDMLDVSEKLSDVRGEIEQTQAEFETLSKQIELATIAIALRAQAPAASFALNWRPLYQLKSAAHDALDGVADYATAMLSVVLYLPVVLLWVATIALAVWIMVRLVSWAIRFFPGHAGKAPEVEAGM